MIFDFFDYGIIENTNNIQFLTKKLRNPRF